MTSKYTPKPVQIVHEITDLQVHVFESFPALLQVSVYASVPTAGWSAPRLVPYTYVQPPPDGIYDFDFVAAPPTESAAQVVSAIRVREALTDNGIKGIRVHAATNCREILLAPALTAER